VRVVAQCIELNTDAAEPAGRSATYTGGSAVKLCGGGSEAKRRQKCAAIHVTSP
jgi:hypothetical protein